MSKTVQDILSMIADNGIQMVDFKMVDINGAYRHVSIPAKNFSEETMKNGIGFDASNYGYAGGRNCCDGQPDSGQGRGFV